MSMSAVDLVHSYLSGRTQFVQIDDHKSSRGNVTFGVPQGSILGPVLFNLYVSDLSKNTTNPNVQYADDTTCYTHCKVEKIKEAKQTIEKDLDTINDWSAERNLILNPKKTFWILFSTPHMSRRHGLEKTDLTLYCQMQLIQRKTNIKLLGITFNENLTWNTHVNELVRSSFGTLSVLRKLKRIAPFSVRKTLAECLVLSRIDYGATIFCGMPDYLRNRLQKIQNAAASFVTGRYNRTKDVLKLNWLPVHERIDFSIAKLTFKIMNNKNSPSYLKLNRYQPPRNLRSNQSRENTLSSNEDGTFQAMATKVFNKLPETVRGELCNAKFIVSAKSFFLEEAKKRLQMI